MALLAVGCGKNGGNNSENNGSEAGDKVSHTISVKSVAGLAMADLDVYIYGDDQLTDLVDFASTDESGIANISLPEGGEYYITLSGVGKGYEVKDYYTFSGTTAVITLNTSLITALPIRILSPQALSNFPSFFQLNPKCALDSSCCN